MKRIVVAAMMMFAMNAAAEYAQINGLKLYYEIHGTPGANPPLVLLHGGGSTIDTTWSHVLPELAKKRQVIAFDQQGHGRTADVVDRPFTFEQSADDAAELLRHLGIARADFFGYSNGGSIAMQIAVRHPRLVRRLIVASAMYKRDGLAPGFWDGMKHASLKDMPAELQEAYLRVAPHPENLQSFHDKSVERMLDFKDWPAEVLKGIDAPVLLLLGDHDVIRPEHAVEMLHLLPHAQLAILPGTDHMTLVEHWPVAMIETFLDAPPSR
jgi:pimeloyl-ACP methyl ester carboxylesterase